jgi:hypothetical protein
MGTTFSATIEHVNHTTSRATVRTHTFLVDRGIAKGGLDLGPAPSSSLRSRWMSRPGVWIRSLPGS